MDTVVERPIEPDSDLPNPFVSEPVIESEPIRVFANPLISELVKDREPVSVLNIEECSVRLVAGESETVSVLNRVMCSPRFETLFSEPVNVLNIEECSTGTTEKLKEPDRLLAKALTSELVKESEPVSDLVSKICSVIADDVLIEPVNSSTRPRDRVIASPSEPPRALPKPLV